ncbi:MAG: hypothetical protein FWE12_08370 [Oscillospiraceae bacterium]|nr:hypothetical protein [Oscillospiraceae bacterium]
MQLIRANKERIKTLFIVLLAASAVILGHATGLFTLPIQTGGTAGGYDMRPSDRAGNISSAARPSAVLATRGDGLSRGHLADQGEDFGPSEGLRALYELFTGHLGQALGSSGDAVPVNRADWEAALSGQSVFFRYDVELPGEVLAQWFGTEVGGANRLMQQLALAVGGDTVYLYFKGRDGIAYRSTTAVRPSDIQDALRTLVPNGARFGFLDPVYAGQDPDAVLLGRYGGIPAIRSYNAVGGVYAQHRDAFLDALGFTPALVRYFDEDGARTIVEGGNTLRIHETGLITSAHASLLVAGYGSLELAEAIEAARRIVQVLDLVSGAAEVYLTDWTYADGQFHLTFNYYLSGVPIWTPSPAATVTIIGRHIAEVSLLVRTFERTGAYAPVMPEIQASAAMGGVPIRLTYAVADGDAGSVSHGAVEMRARWLLLLEPEVRHG